MTAAAILLLLQWYGKGAGVERTFVDGRVWAWIVLDALLLLLVARSTCGRSGRSGPTSTSACRAGCGSCRCSWSSTVWRRYLELRTAYTFNMYSNLETAAGDSNHFLVPRTLP